MHKKLSKIIIPLLILSFFLAPISPILKNKNGDLTAGVETNKANAMSVTEGFPRMVGSQVFTKEAVTSTQVKLKLDIKVGPANSTGDTSHGPATLTATGKTQVLKMLNSLKNSTDITDINTGIKSLTFEESNKLYTQLSALEIATSGNAYYDQYGGYTSLSNDGLDPSKDVFIELANDKVDVNKTDQEETANILKTYTLKDLGTILKLLETDYSLYMTTPVDTLEPSTTYNVRLKLDDSTWHSSTYQYTQWLTFTTPEKTADETALDAGVDSTAGSTSTSLNLGCSIWSWSGIQGCIASFFYMIWGVTAAVAELAGKFLDFMTYYSTNSSSYTNGFVTKAFSAIRDIANIFFIIALLYVAIKTILDLNVTNNKKLIGTIIIVALLINFSLFTTEVIIDATNILAKVFYNQITPIDANGKTLDPAAGGEKSISVGLVSKFDIQNIVDQNTYDKLASPGMFIFIILILIALTLYAAYIFFIVGILFVGRVVMLWISMIFAPIAFASYTMPISIPGLGYKDWWDDLLKNAFLAPIFVFFLYIIVMFAGFLTEIIKYPLNAEIMQKIMSVLIPCVILFVLMMKAKDMAVKLSGSMGSAIISGAKTVGGFVGGAALGVAAGAVAIGGKAVVGQAGSAMANSKWANRLATSDTKFGRFIGRKAQDVGEKAGKSSFDVRGTKLGQFGAQKAGLNSKMVGKPKEGGFEGVKKRRDEKREARKTQLEDRATKGNKKAIAEAESKYNQSQNDRDALNNELAPELNALDSTIKTLQDSIKVKGAAGIGKEDPEMKDAYKKLQEATEKRLAIRNGTSMVGTGKYESVETKDKDGKVTGHVTKEIMVEDPRYSAGLVKATEEDIKNGKKQDEKGNLLDADDKPIRRTLAYMDKNEVPEMQRLVNEQKKLLGEKKAKVKIQYVDDFDTKFNRTVNMVSTLGMSYKGDKATASRMRRVERINYGSAVNSGPSTPSLKSIPPSSPSPSAGGKK
jgi:hypothetical protein